MSLQLLKVISHYIVVAIDMLLDLTKKQTNHLFPKYLSKAADDMGKAEFHKGEDNVVRLKFFGTEIGAFACLDGFSEQAKMQLIGGNWDIMLQLEQMQDEIVPVAEENEVSTGSDLDLLLYINNYDLKKPGEAMVDTSMSVDVAMKHFHDGRRCAAGSTQTGRGGTEISYWANPFPLLKDNDGKILHKELYEKYTNTEEELVSVIEKLVSKGENGNWSCIQHANGRSI